MIPGGEPRERRGLTGINVVEVSGVEYIAALLLHHVRPNYTGPAPRAVGPTSVGALAADPGGKSFEKFVLTHRTGMELIFLERRAC